MIFTFFFKIFAYVFHILRIKRWSSFFTFHSLKDFCFNIFLISRLNTSLSLGVKSLIIIDNILLIINDLLNFWNIYKLLIIFHDIGIVTFERTQSINQNRILLLNILMISMIDSNTLRVTCILRLKPFRSLFLLHCQMGLLLFRYWFFIFTCWISTFLFIHVRVDSIFLRI